MFLGFDFMPLDQIPNVSLNDFMRQVTTCHKTLIEAHMDEILVLLDL